MSETEHVTGKLVPVEIVGDIENTARLILEKEKIDKPDYLDTFLQAVREELYRNYVVCGGKIFKVEKFQTLDDDVYNAHTNPDGSISFELSYYNGGCSFDEAVGYALKKMEEKSG